jgi:hypothetical protein
MVTFLSNSQDQQSIGILPDTYMVEAFHDKTIAVQMTAEPKNAQPDLTGNKNEVQLNAEAILVT